MIKSFKMIWVIIHVGYCTYVTEDIMSCDGSRISANGAFELRSPHS